MQDSHSGAGDTMTVEHRHYSRIRFHDDARLLLGGEEYPCEVCDLSLKGALVAARLPATPAPGERCLLELRLTGDATVRMEGDVAHVEAGRIGLVCRDIDLDSITHLRRLLELNLGDAELLHREFAALIAG